MVTQPCLLGTEVQRGSCITVLGDALGSPLGCLTRLSPWSELLTLSADFCSVKDKNFSFLDLYSGSSAATFASSQTQLRLET